MDGAKQSPTLPPTRTPSPWRSTSTRCSPYAASNNSKSTSYATASTNWNATIDGIIGDEVGIELVRDLSTPVSELHLDVFESATFFDDDSVRDRVSERVRRDILLCPLPMPTTWGSTSAISASRLMARFTLFPVKRSLLREGKSGPNRSYQATIGQTTQDLATEMERLDPESWRASTASGGSYTKSNVLPKASANPSDPGFVLRWKKNGEQFAVACDAYSRLRDNVRTVYLWVHETRLRGQRPVKTGDAAFAAARLPPADGEATGAVAAGPAPHEVLEVSPNADTEVVKAAARSLKKKHHPDRGGDEEAFKRVLRAEEAMLGE